MPKRTPLYEEHLALKGRIIDFGGWDLPVQYSGLSQEHEAVRTKVGIFDVSHMGEILIEGSGAAEFVNHLVTNDVAKLSLMQACYSALLHDHGGIVDDLVIYRLGDQSYFLVVNASNTEKAFQHIEKIYAAYSGAKPEILKNVSSDYAQIAIQGPLAEKVLSGLFQSVSLSDIKTYWSSYAAFNGEKVLVGRTGYTGEDGFEVYLSPKNAPLFWRQCLELGAADGILPCGLGARDTLRTEMKYPLYGHELTDDTNPLEVGLGWVTKLSKTTRFVGQDAVEKVKQAGAPRALVGLKTLSRGIPRQGYEVWDERKSKKIGFITSGTQSPTLKAAIGIALVETAYKNIGTRLNVKIREEFCECVVSETPFVTTSLTKGKTK